MAALAVTDFTTLPFSEKSFEFCAVAVQPRILFSRTPKIAFSPSLEKIGAKIEFQRTSRKNVVLKSAKFCFDSIEREREREMG